MIRAIDVKNTGGRDGRWEIIPCSRPLLVVSIVRSEHQADFCTIPTSAASTTTYFNNCYKRVIHSKLEPMKTVAKSIKERLKNLVSYCTHKITNAVAEAMNSKIMSIKRRVGGFRNRQNFKTAICFDYGYLLLLRWTQPLPTIIPDGPFFVVAVSSTEQQ